MFFFGVLLLVGGFVLAPKMIVLAPSLEIYTALFMQIVPVLLAVVT